MSKLAKFFIICAAVCVLGIVMSFAGYAAGGVDDLQKVADKHEWLNVGPNSTETDLLTVGEFQSIEAEGSLDITVIAPGEELDEEAVPNFVEDMYYQGTAGTVAVKWGKGNGAPVVTNENGVLKIKGSSEDIDTAQVNLTGEDPSPDVIVFCSDNELESIHINDKYGDTAIVCVKSKNTKITAESGDIVIENVEGGEIAAETNTGDINADNIVSSKMALKAGTGDIDISECGGEISAETATGDIEFAAALPQSQFEMDLSINTGEISINEDTIDAKEFYAKGEPNKLVFRTDTGDIDADFSED
ncbi:MAG: DUF4097 family beta strand repeat protein [Firmicutes bacterium]|nr:DUF4097 family beta strand repeat protein [Bacillota bacterium]